MATSQKKTGGSRSASSSSGGRRTASSSSKSKSGSSRSRKQPPAPAHRPFRREVGAGICLLLAIFTKDRFDMMRLETVVGYLLAVEREAGAVRLVMAGKQNGFDMEAIRERLREAYV